MRKNRPLILVWQCQRDDWQRELRATEKKIEAMMKAIEDGLYTASMKERMSELEDRRSALLATEPQASPNVVLHPNTAALYSEKIENLVTSLNADDIRAEAGEILRSLVDRVVLTPDDDGTSLKA